MGVVAVVDEGFDLGGRALAVGTFGPAPFIYAAEADERGMVQIPQGEDAGVVGDEVGEAVFVAVLFEVVVEVAQAVAVAVRDAGKLVAPGNLTGDEVQDGPVAGGEVVSARVRGDLGSVVLGSRSCSRLQTGGRT